MAKNKVKTSHFDEPTRASRRPKKTSWQPGRCPVCGASIKMVPYAEMNFTTEPTHPGKVFNHTEFYWCCSNYPACDTYVSADDHTKRPYGTLAGPALRHKRILVHQWCTAYIAAGRYTPMSFWSMCGYYIGVDKHNCVHARDMTEPQCDLIIKQCRVIAEHDPSIMAQVKPRSKLGQMLGLEVPEHWNRKPE